MLRIRPRLERAMQLAYGFRAVSALTVPCSGLDSGRLQAAVRTSIRLYEGKDQYQTLLIDSLRIHNQKARICFPSFCGHFGSMHGRSIKTK